MCARITALCLLVFACTGPVKAARAIDMDGDGVDDAIDVCCNTPLNIPVDAEGRPLGDIDKDCDVDATDYGLLQASFTGPLSPGCCEDNNDCPADHFCSTNLGDCNGPGQCAVRPQGCLDVWDPVCGCDGVTYSNGCYAYLAGMNIAHEGECPPPTCPDDNDCPGTHYCHRAVGNCSGHGQCAVRPEDCPDVWDPVCGCDLRTYGNDCEAAAAGINVAHAGECKTACRTSADCAFGQYCMYAVGACSGPGQCVTMPQLCLDVWIPVCGCDGVTYSNSCYAARAGMSIAPNGVCHP